MKTMFTHANKSRGERERDQIQNPKSKDTVKKSKHRYEGNISGNPDKKRTTQTYCNFPTTEKRETRAVNVLGGN